jgi:hypothetical protein
MNNLEAIQLELERACEALQVRDLHKALVLEHPKGDKIAAMSCLPMARATEFTPVTCYA